jgi:hypothetical protein
MLAVLLIALVASPAGAQDWSKLWNDPEVENHQLTMAQLRTFVDVLRVVAADPETMATLDREFKTLQQRKPQPTVADVAALVDQLPAVRNAFAKAKVTARDYLVQSAAVANAAMQLTMRKQGVNPRTAAQRANVELLEKNPAEWQKVQEEMAKIVAARPNPKP